MVVIEILIEIVIIIVIMDLRHDAYSDSGTVILGHSLIRSVFRILFRRRSIARRRVQRSLFLLGRGVSFRGSGVHRRCRGYVRPSGGPLRRGTRRKCGRTNMRLCGQSGAACVARL